MKIVLLGYMASGKSTIGQQLAKKLNVSFIDLDHYISQKEQLTISEIFEQKGEIYFRKIEHLYLKEVLTSSAPFVLSLGGGTPCYGNNMQEILNAAVVSIYLQTSIPTIVSRLQLAKSKRPLVADFSPEQLTEFVAKHLFERRNFYEQAHEKIKTDGKTMEEVVAAIRMLLY